MPLDGNYGELSELTRARLSALSIVLRKKMPNDFEWHYEVVSMPLAFYSIRYESTARDVCGTAGCALGLAYKLMGPQREVSSNPNTAVNTVHDWALAFFEMPADMFQGIFFGDGELNEPYNVRRDQVTPLMVATAIDHYLGTGTLPSTWL